MSVADLPTAAEVEAVETEAEEEAAEAEAEAEAAMEAEAEAQAPVQSRPAKNLRSSSRLFYGYVAGRPLCHTACQMIALVEVQPGSGDD